MINLPVNYKLLNKVDIVIDHMEEQLDGHSFIYNFMFNRDLISNLKALRYVRAYIFNSEVAILNFELTIGKYWVSSESEENKLNKEDKE